MNSLYALTTPVIFSLTAVVSLDKSIVTALEVTSLRLNVNPVTTSSTVLLDLSISSPLTSKFRILCSLKSC